MTDDLSLDARDGLPPEMKVLLETYPRETWEGHPNFQGLTAFWLQMHGKFRAVQTELLQLTQDFLDGKTDPMRYGAATSRYSGFFLEGLHGHHNIEDHHYFPLMVALDDRVARAFDLLDADHHALSHHMNALADATNAVLRPLQNGEDARDPAGKLHGVQSDFQTFLDRHLTDEEDVIVPLILEYGDNFH
ncbi:hemerythrin domain-containing protein [Maritimibacter sp. DP07]|jgi:iron-sulfur cluster repair protein YtfE (RIC family)|uniref:Hemerythrin domain-containing protein n=1 Tax=Maritimibacter harenae TaxID=2606218 RepID=A0A845M3F5_9RHOB|nr:hemerythrin domain-containing protein [Maritimibacter harenae]MZR14890.1 hemerythrin domain-containing protein [Maritimibacter harenae]